jgi:hypothetical protein
VSGGTPEEISTANFFVNVDDASVSDVPVRSPASDMRCAPHVVNLQVPAGDPSELWEAFLGQEQSILTRFYDVFGDDYDFANVIYLHPDLSANRDHFGVKNDVQGIGLPPFDNTAGYGSGGALRGITRFPVDTFFDLGEPGAQHELGHQWINFLTEEPLVGPGPPHWPPSQLARGLMGFNIPGSSVGGTFTFDFVPQGGNLYQLVNAAPLGVFTQMDLYLMGFVAQGDVPSYVVLDPPDQTVAVNAIVTGSLVTVDDVIDAHGPRMPAATGLPQEFRMATIVVTRTGPLTDRQLAFFDHFAARGESLVPLDYSIGFAKGTGNPFALATQGIGSLDTSMTCPIPPIEPPPFEEVPICRACPPNPCLSCPGLLRGIDMLIYPIVTDFQVLSGLHSKLLSAGIAYQRRQLDVAARNLNAFLNQLAAQQGKGITRQAAAGISAMTIKVANQLRIPLERATR